MERKKVLIALTFYSDNFFGKMIESFRSRYEENSLLKIPLVPPLELEAVSLDYLIEELKEEVESFYFEHNENHLMTFDRIEVIKQRKTQTLFLRPHLDEELLLLQETLSDITSKFKIKGLAKERKKDPLFRLAQFEHDEDLQQGIADFQKSFTQTGSLAFDKILILIKKGEYWFQEQELFSFLRPRRDPQDYFSL